MRQRWGSLLGGFVIFVAGFYAGGYFGAHRLWAVTEPVMRMEVAAAIHFGIDELLYLRTDQADKALRRMEQRLDGAILGVCGQSLAAAAFRPMSANRCCSRSATAPAIRSRRRVRRCRPALSAVADEPLDPMVARTAARVLLTEAEVAAMKAVAEGSKKP